MSTRKSVKRKAAPHETPPPAVCGRLHVAVAESDHLASVGGGSLPAGRLYRAFGYAPVETHYSKMIGD